MSCKTAKESGSWLHALPATSPVMSVSELVLAFACAFLSVTFILAVIVAAKWIYWGITHSAAENANGGFSNMGP